MKNLKKKLAARGGFTLVELIVVIAILAILAGVGTAAYSGYITKANEAADITALEAIRTAAQATYIKDGAVTKIVVTDGETDSISVYLDNSATAQANTAGNTDFQSYFGSTTFSV
ncbi:MAG: type IV pilin protein, partial [Candidatus Enterenecus sp.]